MHKSSGILNSVAIIGFLFSCAACGQSPNSNRGDHSPEKQVVYPFGGQVTVDGKRPDNNGSVIVGLYRPSEIGEAQRRWRYAVCDGNGRFQFSSYDTGDGLEPSDYIVVVAQLTKLTGLPSLRGRLTGPDRLGNRFNDPELNARNPAFLIKHRAPGNANYRIDLNVKDVPPIAKPGKRAVTEIRGPS